MDTSCHNLFIDMLREDRDSDDIRKKKLKENLLLQYMKNSIVLLIYSTQFMRSFSLPCLVRQSMCTSRGLGK